MTTPAKRKGARGESEVIRLWEDGGFPQAQKTPDGAMLDRGDVAGIPNLTVEVKTYTDFADAVSRGLLDLAREKQNNKTPWGVLFAKRRNKGWVAVMPADEFVALWAKVHGSS